MTIDPHVDGGMIDSEKETLLEQNHLKDEEEFKLMRSETNLAIATKDFWNKHGYIPIRIKSSLMFCEWDEIYVAVQDLFIDPKHKKLQDELVYGLRRSAQSFKNYKRLYTIDADNPERQNFDLFKMLQASKSFKDRSQICEIAPPKSMYALAAIKKMNAVEYKTSWEKKALNRAIEKHC